jgi:recombination protein RecT
MSEENTAVQTAPLSQVPTEINQASHSERFTNAILKEFSSNAGAPAITSFQRKLIQNYFIKLDSSLKDAERKRMAKQEQYRDTLSLTWDNVNMSKLAVDVVAFSSVGLDPAQPNHINLIPYKNNSSNKYDVTFIIGYRGMEIKAMKYGFDVPDDVIIELVYSNDKFRSIKKSWNNRVENYEFEITDDFNRGEIIGGFYYHVFTGNPEKNKLRTFSMKDINKRRPEYASAEFWGGEKDKWQGGQKVGKEVVEGWLDEMCYKTIARAAYNSITIDSEKIDENFVKMMQSDKDSVATKVKSEIAENANKTELTFEDAHAEDVTNQRQLQQAEATIEPVNLNQPEAVQQTTKGPGF